MKTCQTVMLCGCLLSLDTDVIDDLLNWFNGSALVLIHLLTYSIKEVVCVMPG